MPGAFAVPEVAANDEGWGPTTVPEQLDGVPYAPFGKGDKIGRVSDFTNSGFSKYGGVQVKLWHRQCTALDDMFTILQKWMTLHRGEFLD